MSDSEPEQPWSDAYEKRWSDGAANIFSVRIAPRSKPATEVVLEGCCPRCRHPMVSTHPVRAVLDDELARARARAEGIDLSRGWLLRRVTLDCTCRHDHADTPAGEDGCGVPIALWVMWSPDGTHTELAAAGSLSYLDLQEERLLEEAAHDQLVAIRRAAESWRTGLAGFLAVLVAIFFIKGKESFDDVGSTALQLALAAVLVGAAASALAGGYRALRAAYGTPRDEHLGEVGPVMRRLHPTTPRDIADYGTLSAWHHALARQSISDLRRAKVLTVLSLVLVIAAAVITWFAHGPKPA